MHCSHSSPRVAGRHVAAGAALALAGLVAPMEPAPAQVPPPVPPLVVARVVHTVSRQTLRRVVPAPASGTPAAALCSEADRLMEQAAALDAVLERAATVGRR